MQTEPPPSSDSLQARLDLHSSPADPTLCFHEEGMKVRCLSCAHRCLVSPGNRGICRMRYNRDGVLYAPSGYVAGLQIDPMEKKPFYHVTPGGRVLSFGMLGCNFHCDFCQNWVSSQALRDPRALSGFTPCTADSLVEFALKHHLPTLVSTYNEPFITADWAARVFERAKGHRLLCGFVSNGYATPEVLEYLHPFMDFCNVDLKCFSEAGYSRLGGRLKPVLDSIEHLFISGCWVEIVTLIVPGFNDTPEELRNAAAFLAALSREIPWHVTAFYPTYKRTAATPTPPRLLERAWNIGKEAGLHYVYTGNMGGEMGHCENTFCPHCGDLLIQRRGFHLLQNRITHETCPRCGSLIAGRLLDTPTP